MNEQVIIEYLKQNKTKGVAFGFMPAEVQHWCGFHSPDKIFKVFNGVWSDSCCVDYFTTKHIYCLTEDYEPKPEFKAHWEEFQIDEEGFFVEEQVNTHVSPRVYHWWQWTKFLSDNDEKYNNFGGWLYDELLSNGEKTGLLVTSPRIIKPGKGLTSGILFNCKDETKPAYPIKILFWRYKE